MVWQHMTGPAQRVRDRGFPPTPPTYPTYTNTLVSFPITLLFDATIR